MVSPREGSGARMMAGHCASGQSPTRHPFCSYTRSMISTLTTPDGVALHVQAWPTTGPGHGTVLIVHGLGEHIGRYARVAAHLDARGWNVVGYDHRGHGRSGGAKGRIVERDDLLR